MRWSSTILMVLAMAGATVDAAGAADRCAALRGELAALGKGGLPSDRYRICADRQRAALARTEAMARRCGGAAAALPACRDLAGTLARMRANLSSLEAMAKRGGGASAARRSEIRAQLKDGGCGVPRLSTAMAAPAPTAPARRTAKPKRPEPARAPVVEAALRPSTSPVALPAEKPSAAPSVDTAMPAAPAAPPFDRSLLTRFPASASYRTLCVRTCDGYYFPLSWSVTRDAFEADAAACTAACPGSPTALYVHPTGSEPDQSESLEGKAYKDLPAAYLYRTKRVPACGCETAGTAAVPAAAPAAPDMPDAANAPVEDWQIPDGDRSTVPAPAEDGSQSMNRDTPATFATRRFPANAGAVQPVATNGATRKIWPAVGTP